MRHVRGKILHHDFTFTNTGDEPLRILEVTPDCACFSVDDDKLNKVVDPGATGIIPIDMDTGHVELGNSPRRSITVKSNATRSPVVTLYMECQLWERLVITPKSVMFGVVPRNTPRKEVVELVNNAREGLELRLSECTSPAFTAQLEQTQKGKSYSLTVRTATPLKAGSHAGDIVLDTNVRELPQIRIVVSCYAAPDVHVNPLERIALPKGKLGKELGGPHRVQRDEAAGDHRRQGQRRRGGDEADEGGGGRAVPDPARLSGGVRSREREVGLADV
ncbi:MAG: DUF1573 domain-containing protein [Planctomycetota bacterium]